MPCGGPIPRLTRGAVRSACRFTSEAVLNSDKSLGSLGIAYELTGIYHWPRPRLRPRFLGG
jgi:hypothetical protein